MWHWHAGRLDLSYSEEVERLRDEVARLRAALEAEEGAAAGGDALAIPKAGAAVDGAKAAAKGGKTLAPSKPAKKKPGSKAKAKAKGKAKAVRV